MHFVYNHETESNPPRTIEQVSAHLQLCEDAARKFSSSGEEKTRTTGKSNGFSLNKLFASMLF